VKIEYLRNHARSVCTGVKQGKDNIASVIRPKVGVPGNGIASILDPYTSVGGEAKWRSGTI
jgi:hypothetical protein